MKTSSEIKRFFKEKFGIPVRVRTGTGKGKWQQVWITPKQIPNSHHQPLVYDYIFPEHFRIECLKIVYPNTPTLHVNPSAGNVRAHSISLVATEWIQIIDTYVVPSKA